MTMTIIVANILIIGFVIKIKKNRRIAKMAAFWREFLKN